MQNFISFFFSVLDSPPFFLVFLGDWQLIFYIETHSVLIIRSSENLLPIGQSPNQVSTSAEAAQLENSPGKDSNRRASL